MTGAVIYLLAVVAVVIGTCGGWNGRPPTLLGLVNKVAWPIFDRGLGHRVREGAAPWRPWWHGFHIRGSWYVIKPEQKEELP